MRSKLLVCAALASLGVCSSFASVAHAAGAKNKAAAKEDKKKPNELHADDKSMKKQLQWEDKVMGPDDKRAELEKIARANAINEKAAKEREKQAALEAAAPPKAAAPAPDAGKGKAKGLRNEVAIPSTPDETKLNEDKGKTREISPKLATDEAKAPVPAAKPADDKFIDKLLKEERPSTGKKSSASDRELDALLAGAKDKPAGGRRGKHDDVDDMIKSAEKGPAMPAPRAPSAQPDWMKQPEISSTPAVTAPPPPAPVAVKPAPKDDGVIHVVQGAAAPQAAPAAPAPVAARGLGIRKRGAKGPPAPAVTWNDPFADKKAVASRDRDQDSYAPAPRKEPAARSAPTPAAWSDPFADSPEPRRTTHRSAPAAAPAAATPPAPKRNKESDAAHQPGWKDPFTKAPSEPSHAPVAMRELNKGESSKWEIAARRTSPSHAAPAADSHVGGWGVLKKRGR